MSILKCDHCQAPILDPSEAYKMKNGETWCVDCGDRDSEQCTRCKGTVPASEQLAMRTKNWSQYWCASCREAYASDCAKCGDRFPVEALGAVGQLCRNCHQGLYPDVPFFGNEKPKDMVMDKHERKALTELAQDIVNGQGVVEACQADAEKRFGPAPDQAASSDADLCDELIEVFGDTISTYSRSHAIEDGVLVDLSDSPFIKEFHDQAFQLPVAATRAAYSAAIGDPDEQQELDQATQRGRWAALALSIRIACTRDEDREIHDQDRISFVLTPVQAPERHIAMYAHFGKGDNGENVMTIMMEGED